MLTTQIGNKAHNIGDFEQARGVDDTNRTDLEVEVAPAPAPPSSISFFHGFILLRRHCLVGTLAVSWSF